MASQPKGMPQDCPTVIEPSVDNIARSQKRGSGWRMLDYRQATAAFRNLAHIQKVFRNLAHISKGLLGCYPLSISA